MTALFTLRHAYNVATYKADQDGPDGYPLIGSVERGDFLHKEVARLLNAVDHSGLVDEVKAVRVAAEGDSTDLEIDALIRALDTALNLLGLPETYHTKYDPSEEG